ncbi:hypothetical protein G6F31_014373 [Rhizopus arrhizus]|nr:hypothetical protein G6F31_014373 [Rhizopus arrhizus]
MPRADQGIARCAAESACVGDATEIQTGTQRVGQRGHRAGARVGHHDRHGKGHRITDRDRAGGTAGLGHRDPRRGHGRSGGAVAAAGGVIGAGTDHGVDHLAAGLRIDGGRVAQTVSSGHGPGRQRAHQRIGGVAGERTGVADTGEIQAGAQGIGQRQQVAGVAIGHGDIDGVAHRRAHRDRAGRVGALGIAYAGHRHGHVAARAVVGIGAAGARCGRIPAVEGVVATADTGVIGQHAGRRCSDGHRQGEHRTGPCAACRCKDLGAGAGDVLAAGGAAPVATDMRAAPVRRDAGWQLVTHGDRARRHIRRIAGRHIAGVAHRQRVLGTGLAIIPDAAGGIVALHHLQRRRGDGDPVVLNLAVVGHAGRLVPASTWAGTVQGS